MKPEAVGEFVRSVTRLRILDGEHSETHVSTSFYVKELYSQLYSQK
jgi:hypothetical protein